MIDCIPLCNVCMTCSYCLALSF